MRPHWKPPAPRVALALALAAFACLVLRADTIVSEDSPNWRYFKGVSEASAPDVSAWRRPDFNDAAWALGRGPFYYEDSAGFSGNTALTDMRGKYSCVFLRHTFNVSSPAGISELTLYVQTDDGCVVWLNGTEVARVNMPEGTPPYNGTSLPAAGEPNLATVTIDNANSVLRAGVNVLAVQAFNSSLTDSSDFLIAASLSGNLDVVAPALIDVLPAPGARIRALDHIEVIFNENVTGVSLTDLLINGAPATGLSVISPRQYTFTFLAPPPGSVTVAWSPDAGISDLATPPNPFTGSPWSYTLDPNAPPADLILSEFLAINDHGIRDNFGTRSDWIELLNRSTATAELDGWFLTDDRTQLTKWRFPAVTIPQNGYYVVWASGLDQTNPLAPLHTNFKLDGGGEYLALVDPQGRIVSEFSPTYPEQRPDISYGRDRTSPALTGYLTPPTPGAANATRGSGFAPEPVFSFPGGTYTNSTLTLRLSAPSGTIRFTTDGSRPTTTSPVYTAPISITRSQVIQARVFQDGLLPSAIAVHPYNLLGSGLTAFSSNLPLIVLNTSGRGIGAETRTPATIASYEPFRGRAALSMPPTFQGNCQLELRGQSSLGFPKTAYNLEINDSEGNDLEIPLLGLPSESDWVLYNPYSDKPFLQNFLAYELHEKMGHYSPRRRFVEVFVDTNGGKLEYPADYMGIYILVEKIKVDANRVDLARLSPLQNSEPDVSGGYIIKKDKDSPGDRNFSTQGGNGFSAQSLKIHEPKPREITSAQLAWIRNYLLQFEKSLYSANWLKATGTNHYSHYIDVDSFVDNHWIVEFPKQIDGYRLSNYMSKDRGGKLRMEPIWDWNLSFGNADYLQGQNTAGWYYNQLDENAHIWLRRLMCGTTSPSGTSGDPDFNQKITDRWSVLRTNLFSSDTLLPRIDELAAYLDEAQIRDFNRWPRLGVYIWPNPPIYSSPTTYAGIIANLKNWVRGRYQWIDGQFLKSPLFDHPDAAISPGFALGLSAPSGSLYYTTDGTDPRAPGGAIASNALLYSAPVTLTANSRVVARARLSNRWSGPTAATYLVDLPPLAVTELMVSPSPSPNSSIDDSARFEFIELCNTGSQPLDLRGFEFTRGIQFAFATNPITLLPAGERIVVARDPQALRLRHGHVPNLAGTFVGALDNQGERITLVGPRQEVVLDFSYDPAGVPAADGLGFALVPIEDAAPQDNLSDPMGWRAGSTLGGTPGRAEPPAPAFPVVLISEVLTHTDAPLVGTIELVNVGNTAADLSGWFLSDDPQTPKFRIPSGTRLDSGAFMLFTESDFNPSPGFPPSFDLRASGDEAYLFSADDQGRLTGYVHGRRFGAALEGVSFGRYLTSTGEDHFVALSERTLGRTNASPRIGPVVISEIHYHPPDVAANNALWDNTEDEFIELVNVADITVPLFDPTAPTNTWRLRDAVTYRFPTNQTLNPGARLLVVSFDPIADPVSNARFRTRFNLEATTRLFGPFDGKLANSRDSVELVQPDLVRFYATNEVVTSVLVDRVDYRDTTPWPPGADSLGFSLQRRLENGYGNDPINWTAATPTPGGPLPPQPEPVLLSHPLSQECLPGSTVTLTAQATGTPTLTYQWRWNGENLPAETLPTLTLTNAQPSQSGEYQVVVSTPYRSVASRSTALKVRTPPSILQPPAPAQAQVGQTVTFSVIAVAHTAAPLRYQWRHNGTPIANAHQPTLRLAEVNTALAGQYDVTVTDPNGAMSVSAPANLVVLGLPDTDQDGMPDDFERRYELDPHNPADAALDADRDGATNLEEYLAGTDPTRASSVLKVTEIQVGQAVVIRFECLTSRSYTLLSRDTLPGSPWLPIADVPSVPNAGSPDRLVEIVDPRSASLHQRYYRIITPALDHP